MNHPTYKHRTFVSLSDNPEDFCDMDMVDCIDFSVYQAEAIILQMQAQYESNRPQMSDEINTYTLEAIRKEILDIKTVVNWYFKKSKEGENHG